MLVDALEAKVADYLARHQSARDGENHALVVRNGHARPRHVTMGSGTVKVRAPRVNDRRVDDAGARNKFTSAILPPYMRRTPQVAEVLPLLYLRGLSTGDFAPALQSLIGERASGLSASAIARMTDTWQSDYTACKRRDMKEQQYVYLWADGVHFNVRLEEDRLCTLVLIGVRADGQKQVIAVEDGYRESKMVAKAVKEPEHNVAVVCSISRDFSGLEAGRDPRRLRAANRKAHHPAVRDHPPAAAAQRRDRGVSRAQASPPAIYPSE